MPPIDINSILSSLAAEVAQRRKENMNAGNSADTSRSNKKGMNGLGKKPPTSANNNIKNTASASNNAGGAAATLNAAGASATASLNAATSLGASNAIGSVSNGSPFGAAGGEAGTPDNDTILAQDLDAAISLALTVLISHEEVVIPEKDKKEKKKPNAAAELQELKCKFLSLLFLI